MWSLEEEQTLEWAHRLGEEGREGGNMEKKKGKTDEEEMEIPYGSLSRQFSLSSLNVALTGLFEYSKVAADGFSYYFTSFTPPFRVRGRFSSPPPSTARPICRLMKCLQLGAVGDHQSPSFRE